MIKRPGGELATRPLHFIWICDCSGSMAGEKIAQLNRGVLEAIPHMQSAAEENPNAQVLVRAVRFASGASWHLAQPTDVSEFSWNNLSADGVTDMGHAFSLVADVLKVPPMSDRGLPPVLVLLSDGQPTDDYKQGLAKLLALPWGKKAVRVSIAIGGDADMGVLQEFIGHNELKPLEAKNPEQLVALIRWASTSTVQAASAPTSRASEEEALTTNVPLPEAPDVSTLGGPEVW